MINTILIVDDDPVYRLILNSTFRNGSPNIVLQEASNEQECMQILKQHCFDIILLDYELGETNGLAVLKNIIDTQQHNSPVIMISSHDDDELMHACIKAGAQDYLLKSDIDLRSLSRSMRYAKERSSTLQRLDYIANHDNLTNIGNRGAFMSRLERRLGNTTEKDMHCLFFIDLDNFKPINDQYGHDAGDELLKTTAERIQSIVRNDDFVARLGGDEFAVLMSFSSEQPIYKNRAEELLSAITQPALIKGHNIDVACSVGIAIFPKHASSASELLKKSDIAMYKSKSQGKNCWNVFTTEN